jgi:hypothetical protein
MYESMVWSWSIILIYLVSNGVPQPRLGVIAALLGFWRSPISIAPNIS